MQSETGHVSRLFFVKQKTAYEVRISDWSSDVFSSDLEHRLDATSTATPCRSLISRARPSASSRRASADNSAGNAISYSRATVEFLREIGRASGRDRVSQYV